MDNDREPNTEQFIKIAVLENAIEAQLIDSILTDRVIPHRIRSHHDTAYDGLFQAQKGWGEIQAPQQYQAEIMDIIDRVRENNNESG
jgi:hypothetical protein